MEPIPGVIDLDDIEGIVTDGASGRMRIRRLVTQATNGSRLLLGVVEMWPGANSTWSFETEDPRLDGVRYWGDVDETYFILRGRMRVSWAEHSAECGPNQAFYFAPGHRYTCESLGDVPLLAVYALAPSPI